MLIIRLPIQSILGLNLILISLALMVACLLKLKTTTQQFALSLIPIPIGFLMLITHNLSTKLLATMLIGSFWLFYLVVKSFIPLNLLSQTKKKMTSYRKWLQFGVIAKRVRFRQQKPLSKPRSFTRHPLLRWLRLHSKLSWLSLSYGMSRIRLNTLRLLRSRLKWLSVILWESAKRLEQWMDRH